MDTENFKNTYLQYHPKLYRIAFVMMGNSEDAEDILQETYLKLWNMRERLASVRNSEAFAVTVLKNLCLDHLRSPGAEKYKVSQEKIAMASGASPDNGYQEKSDLELVKRLIEELPEVQRLVIRLRGIDEMPMEEIALITGLSEVNVRTVLSRARKTIREQYKKINGHER